MKTRPFLLHALSLSTQAPARLRVSSTCQRRGIEGE